jgi:predicted nucleotidyltransferase component of viral defense system
MQRTIPRDLFDVWHLLEVENKNIEDYVFDFQEKTKFKELEPDMFVETILRKENVFKKQWETSLVNQIKEIPDFAEVWRTLGKHWRKFEKQIRRKDSGSRR